MSKKEKVIEVLMKIHGFGKQKAENLIEKYIDVFEVNEEETEEEIALQLEECYLQGY